MNKLSFLSCFLLLISIMSVGQQRGEAKSDVPAKADSLLYNIFPVIDGQVVYEKVIEVPGKSKGDIYKAIKAWASSAFISQKDALQSDDLGTGLVIYKFNFTSSFESPKIDKTSMTVDTRYWQNLKVYIKDDRAKVVIDNLKLDIGEGSSYIISTYDADNKAFNEKAIQEFKKTMKVSEKMEAKMRDNASRYDRAVIENFRAADKNLRDIISNIEKSITGKSEFDF